MIGSDINRPMKGQGLLQTNVMSEQPAGKRAISCLIGHPLLEFIAMEPISYISNDEGQGGNNGGAYYPQQQLQQSQDFLNQIVQTLRQANAPPDALPPFQTIKGGISIKVADSHDEEIWIRLAPACASP